MVVHWETSLKSLYVRTVWIDGRRHAVLSKDDPVANSLSPIVTSLSRSSRGSSPETNISSTSSQDFTLNANPLNLSNIRLNNNYLKYEQHRLDKNYPTAKQVDESTVHEKNPLSERVMQWLDLAGRENLNLGIDNIEFDDSKKNDSDLSKNSSRRNSTNDEYNNVKMIGKYKKNNKKSNSKKIVHKYQEVCLSDDENKNVCSTYLFDTTMVSNDIFNYAKSSFNNVEIKNDTIYAIKTSIPSNLIQFNNDTITNNKNKSDSAYAKLNKSKCNEKRPQTSNLITMRTKLNNEEGEIVKKSSPYLGKCFESHYLELVRKRISENNNYNMKAARRQLHIFIPSLPKLMTCDSTTSSILSLDE